MYYTTFRVTYITALRRIKHNDRGSITENYPKLISMKHAKYPALKVIVSLCYMFVETQRAYNMSSFSLLFCYHFWYFIFLFLWQRKITQYHKNYVYGIVCCLGGIISFVFQFLFVPSPYELSKYSKNRHYSYIRYLQYLK